MDYRSYFNIYEHPRVTKDSLTVEFNPGVDSFSYVVFKDGKEYLNGEIENGVTSIKLSETGNYYINYIVDEEVIKSGIYRIDKEAPIIKLFRTSEELVVGDKFDFKTGFKASDNVDGDITKYVISNYDSIDFSRVGVKKLVYTVSDEAGNITTETLLVNVVPLNNVGMIGIRIALVTFLLAILVLVFSFIRKVKFEKRLRRFVLKDVNEKSITYVDRLKKSFRFFVLGISKVLSKFKIIRLASKKYEKYVNTATNICEKGIDFISVKLIVSVVFLFIAVIYTSFRLVPPSFNEGIIVLIIGYFLPNIYYGVRYRMFRKKIDNDLLQAIVIMNNSFKAGLSIQGAMSNVSAELSGNIAEEFKLMSMELGLGLSLDVVFARFSARVQTEEAMFLTASLSILNQTGGNIIKVFDNIERSLYSKKALKIEFDNLTKSSKFITIMLSILPIVFVLIISILNNEYFLVFFRTSIGNVILGIIILIYIVYLFVINRLLKVKL